MMGGMMVRPTSPWADIWLAPPPGVLVLALMVFATASSGLVSAASASARLMSSMTNGFLAGLGFALGVGAGAGRFTGPVMRSCQGVAEYSGTAPVPRFFRLPFA